MSSSPHANSSSVSIASWVVVVVGLPGKLLYWVELMYICAEIEPCRTATFSRFQPFSKAHAICQS